MLFSGAYTQKALPDLRGKKYAAVFQPSGKLLKRFDSTGQDAKPDPEDSSRLPEGALIMGTDGNAYLLTADKVLVVSPSGQILKKYLSSNPTRISPPSECNIRKDCWSYLLPNRASRR